MRISVSVTPGLSAARATNGAAGTNAAAATPNKVRLRILVISPCCRPISDTRKITTSLPPEHPPRQREGRPGRRSPRGSGGRALDDVAEQLPDLAVPAHQL